MSWQKSTPKGLNLTSIMFKFNPKWSEINFQRQKSTPKGPNLTHRGSKSNSRGSKSTPKGPKRTFWVNKLDSQRHKIDSQRPKVNSYGPKYKPKAQNWLAEVQPSSRCLKVTPRATIKGLITVPQKLITKAQIRRPKTRNRLPEARLWLLEAQN